MKAMRYWFTSMAMSVILLLSPLTARRGVGTQRREDLPGPSREQLVALERLKRSSRGDVTIRWNERNWTPTFLRGRLGVVRNVRPGAANRRRARQLELSEAAIRDVGAAEQFLKRYKRLFKIRHPGREFILREHTVDSLGMKHLTFDQYYKGIPVWASSLIVHINRAGEIYAINGRYEPTPRQLRSAKARIPAERAIQIAVDDLKRTVQFQPIPPHVNEAMKYRGPSAEKVIFHERDTGRPHLAWQVSIRPNVRDHWYYFVDATDGRIIFRYNATAQQKPSPLGPVKPE